MCSKRRSDGPTAIFGSSACDLGWGIPDPEWDRGAGPLDARKTTLRKVIEDTGAETLTYLYDFGDGWEHTIKIERIGLANPALTYPALIEAIGRCPPEDVGGPPGYEEFLAALADPGHKRHAEVIEWHGDSFDPKAVDFADTDRAIQDTARRWNRPRKTKPI